MYADDITFQAPSANALSVMYKVCDIIMQRNVQLHSTRMKLNLCTLQLIITWPYPINEK